MITEHTDTPKTDDIISDLESALESSREHSCTCGTDETSCRHCSKHIRAFEIATKAIGEIEREQNEEVERHKLTTKLLVEMQNERDQLRSRVAELEKDKELIDSLPFNFVQVAELLLSIGWSSPMDAQWTRLLAMLSNFRQAIDAAKGNQ